MPAGSRLVFLSLHNMNFRPKKILPPASTLPFIYGIHPILEALRSGKEIDKILLKKGMHNQAIEDILEEARQRHIPVQEVPIEKLNRTTGKPHQGIIAFLALVEYQDIEHILPLIFEKGETPLLVILDRVTDVRNFGAICRSASCAGAHAVIIPSRGAAQINEDTVKSSAGALSRIPVCRAHNLKETIRFLKDSGVSVLGITEKSSADYFKTDMKTPVALLMGSEEDGISPEYLKLCDERVKIPMAGPVESLNVSVATGIMLFEAVRQRSTHA